jgi:PAS domain S-box-containing protein
MLFDIRTIIVIIGILQLVQVLVFIYQYIATKNINGPGWWLTWSAVETIGFFIILARNMQSIRPFVLIIQDTALLAGTIFLYIGVVRFFDKKVNYKFLIFFFSGFLLIHLFFLIIKDDLLMRSFIFAFCISVISYVTAFTIYRNKTTPILLTANLNTSIFLIHGSIFAYRSVMILIGTPIPDMFEPTLFNFLPYADALIVSLLWTFGLIIMLNQKLNSEIRETTSKFELIFNTSPDAALISRLDDGMIVDFNETFTQIAGYKKEDIKGNSTLDLQFWKNPSDRISIIDKLNEHGYCENQEIQFHRKGGEEFTGLFSAKIITLNGIPHILSVTRDITRRKKADEEIRLKNEELKKINMEKDKLFSVIAHDLRNPITAFMGLSEMMADKLSDITKEEIQKMAIRMKDSSSNLFGLLENLLEWSKVEQGMIRYYPELTPLLPLTEESVSKLIDSARLKGIEITTVVEPEISILSDKNIFQTILRNLISNAVKFTPRNGIISVSAKALDVKFVEISVKDTGIGMSREIVDNLFKLDSQTNRLGTNGEPSTGLGLILCKGFIEKQGGRIRVESEAGRGSTFHFTVPSGN